MLKKPVIIFLCLFFTSFIFAAEAQAPEKNIFQFEKTSMNVLLSWGVASVAYGGVLLSNKSVFLRGFGIQNIAWGVIDSVLALGIKAWAADKEKKGTGAEQEALNMANIFLINFFLDILYMFVGVMLVIKGSQAVKGHGTGVILQGLFLFVFDGICYLMVINF